MWTIDNLSFILVNTLVVKFVNKSSPGLDLSTKNSTAKGSNGKGNSNSGIYLREIAVRRAMQF
jgi:hypothetical protein